MSTFAILAIAWIPVAAGLCVALAFFLGWLDDRAIERKLRTMRPLKGPRTPKPIPKIVKRQIRHR
jgi:hypothetical protein